MHSLWHRVNLVGYRVEDQFETERESLPSIVWIGSVIFLVNSLRYIADRIFDHVDRPVFQLLLGCSPDLVEVFDVVIEVLNPFLCLCLLRVHIDLFDFER